MHLRSLLIALALTSTAALAQETPQTYAERIAQSLGLEQLLTYKREQGIKSARMEMQTALDELSKAGIPKETITRLTPLMDRMVDKVIKSWDAKEAAMIYADGLTQVLTPQQLSEAEHYYKTKDGKNAFLALQASLEKVNDYIRSRENAALRAEYKEFIRQVQQAVTQK